MGGGGGGGGGGGAAAGRWRWAAAGVLVLGASGELLAAERLQAVPSLWTQRDELAVPALFRELAEEPGDHPILMLPFRGWDSTVLWASYHRQPVTEGLGDTEDFSQSSARQDWIAANPGLVALQAIGQGRQQDVTHDPALVQALEETGLHWAVIFRDQGGGLIGPHEAFFGRQADYEEDLLLAWSLVPPEGE